MKKYLSIIILGLFWFNSSYAETVNLNCKYLSGNISKFYVGLDFKNSKFINQHGVMWDIIYNDNIVQTAFFGEGGTHSHYLMTISRLSGSGSIKAFKLSEEELDKLSQKNIPDTNHIKSIKGISRLLSLVSRLHDSKFCRLTLCCIQTLKTLL